MTLKQRWDYIQSLFDLDGDIWMGAWTLIMVFRIAGVFWHYPAITLAEATAYGSAVTAFAYSNRKQCKPETSNENSTH